MNAIACDNLSVSKKHDTGKSSDSVCLSEPREHAPCHEHAVLQQSQVGVSIHIILQSDILRRWNEWHFKDILPILRLYSVTLNIPSIGRISDIQSDCSSFQTRPSECVKNIADPRFTRQKFLWFYTTALAWHISRGKKVGWGLGSVVAPASFPLHQSTCV